MEPRNYYSPGAAPAYTVVGVVVVVVCVLLGENYYASGRQLRELGNDHHDPHSKKKSYSFTVMDLSYCKRAGLR